MLTEAITRVDNWSEDRVTELRKLWLEGKSASQISRQLGGVSRNAVIGKVHRIGLAGRDRPAAPRAVGKTNNRPSGAGPANSAPRRRPATSPGAPIPLRVVGPELTATATIMSLGHGQCRWPIGDPQEEGFGYCGRSQGQHASYCDHHAASAMHRRQISPRGADAGQTVRSAPGPLTAFQVAMSPR